MFIQSIAQCAAIYICALSHRFLLIIYKILRTRLRFEIIKQASYY
jgi:hypothetical protein